ncbi:MAG: hypothetical protein AB7L09_06980 [Nitrospira sp.]
MTTNIRATYDARPPGFYLTKGQAQELHGADVLPPTLTTPTIISEKAFDADGQII